MSKSGQYFYRLQEAADFEDTDDEQEHTAKRVIRETIKRAIKEAEDCQQRPDAKTKAVKYSAATPARHGNRGQFRGGDRSAN